MVDRERTLHLLALLVISSDIVFSDRIEKNEETIAFLAKELRSLHRNIQTKINHLQRQISDQRNVENQLHQFEARTLYKTFRDIRYQLLTLNLDIRQLFYEGLNMKTEINNLMDKKTQLLSGEMKELRSSIKKINSLLNIRGTVEVIQDGSTSKGSIDSGTLDNESGNTQQSDGDKTSTPKTTTKEVLQTLYISMDINQTLTVPCYLDKSLESLRNVNVSFPRWIHNADLVTPTEKRYSFSYSEEEHVSTLTIKKLRYKDGGILECREDSGVVLLRVNLKIKEPCGEFLCSGACIEMYRICDKTKDCAHGQDERSCDLLADVTDDSDAVIVLLNKMKGWVCNEAWSMSSAGVLCRSLGYKSGKIGQPLKVPEKQKGFLVTEMNCTGDEMSLAQCRYTIANISSCSNISSTICSD